MLIPKLLQIITKNLFEISVDRQGVQPSRDSNDWLTKTLCEESSNENILKNLLFYRKASVMLYFTIVNFTKFSE